MIPLSRVVSVGDCSMLYVGSSTPYTSIHSTTLLHEASYKRNNISNWFIYSFLHSFTFLFSGRNISRALGERDFILWPLWLLFCVFKHFIFVFRIYSYICLTLCGDYIGIIRSCNFTPLHWHIFSAVKISAVMK